MGYRVALCVDVWIWLSLTCVWSVCRWYTLKHICLTILCKNSSSLRVLKMKDEINPNTLNYVMYAGTWSEQEIWVGWVYRLCFTSLKVYVKIRQTNSLKNINFCCKLSLMWCDRGGIPRKCFCVWNLNAWVWFL